MAISEHESEALRHPRILEFHKFFSEYQFWLEAGKERFRIKVRVYETNDGRFYFVQSHFIHVPNRNEPSSTFLTHATPHLALSTAVSSITTFYEDAVSEGLEPVLDWFVPNTLF